MSTPIQVTITIDPIAKTSNISTNAPALAKDPAKLHGIFLDAARACLQQIAGPPKQQSNIVVPQVRIGNGR